MSTNIPVGISGCVHYYKDWKHKVALLIVHDLSRVCCAIYCAVYGAIYYAIYCAIYCAVYCALVSMLCALTDFITKHGD